MNYEEAEVVLYALDIMHEANLKTMDPAIAEATKQRSIERLIRAWLIVNTELSPIKSVTELAEPYYCSACGTGKPLFLFREDTEHNFSERCMDCEAADKYRSESRQQEELPRRLVTKETVWRAIEKIRAQRGAQSVFDLEELAAVVGGELRVSGKSVLNNVRYHVFRFRKAGVLWTWGNAEPDGMGRPRALYHVARDQAPRVGGID